MNTLSKETVRETKREFVSIFIDYNNKRMKDVVLGKSLHDLHHSSIAKIAGRENVKNVIVIFLPHLGPLLFLSTHRDKNVFFLFIKLIEKLQE